MELKARATGNLVEDVKFQQKDNSNSSYAILKVAVNVSKDETIYVTAFSYDISEKRAKYFVKGSLVSVYGRYTDKIDVNPNTNESYINRVINAKDVDLLVSKAEKEEQPG